MMGFGMFGGTIMILFWIGLIALVLWGVSTIFNPKDINSQLTKQKEKSPLEILDERYARGEVEANEYQEAKRNLTE